MDEKCVIQEGNVWELFNKGSLIGEGSFGKVYKATDKRTGEERAIKVLKAPALGGVRRAEAEREVSLHLRSSECHPRLIRLYSVHEDEITNEISLVMELAHTDLFTSVMKHGRYEPQQAKRLLVLLVEALVLLHKQGVAHRDVKLENLLLMHEDEGRCDFRICDLGGAKWFPAGSAPETHTQIGTKGYCAPEAYTSDHCQRITYDAFKVDVYSLGVVLYILLGGYPPWNLNRTEPAERPYPPRFLGKTETSKRWKDVPEEAQALITRMLHPDPSARIALEAVLADPWFLAKDLDQWCPVEADLRCSLDAATEQPDAGPTRVAEGATGTSDACFTIEMWQNQRFRLSSVMWCDPYTRGAWTDRDAATIFASTSGSDDRPPREFRLPGCSTVGTASCISCGVAASGDLVQCDEVSCGEWRYATAWSRHSWYKAPSWRSFVRRRKWLINVRPVEAVAISMAAADECPRGEVRHTDPAAVAAETVKEAASPPERAPS